MRQFEAAAPCAGRIVPFARRAAIFRHKGAAHRRDELSGQLLRPLFQFIPGVERRIELRQRQLDENAPCVVVEPDGRAPLDVGPAPAARRKALVVAVQQAAAEVQEIEDFPGDGVALRIVQNLSRQLIEQGGFEVAVGAALLDHQPLRQRGPGGEGAFHLFECFSLRDAEPFGYPPASVRRLHDPGLFKPLQIPAHRLQQFGFFHKKTSILV